MRTCGNMFRLWFLMLLTPLGAERQGEEQAVHQTADALVPGHPTHKPATTSKPESTSDAPTAAEDDESPDADVATAHPELVEGHPALADVDAASSESEVPDLEPVLLQADAQDAFTGKSELKSELESELKSELKSEIKSELKSELESEIKSELESELESELKSSPEPKAAAAEVAGKRTRRDVELVAQHPPAPPVPQVVPITHEAQPAVAQPVIADAAPETTTTTTTTTLTPEQELKWVEAEIVNMGWRIWIAKGVNILIAALAAVAGLMYAKEHFANKGARSRLQQPS